MVAIRPFTCCVAHEPRRSLRVGGLSGLVIVIAFRARIMCDRVRHLCWFEGACLSLSFSSREVRDVNHLDKQQRDELLDVQPGASQVVGSTETCAPLKLAALAGTNFLER